MEPIETLADFYRRHPVGDKTEFPENNTGQGHFNVFLREPCLNRSPFGRRDFYKVALVIGKGKMIYADKQVVIDRQALVFSSPAVPSAWESGGGPQSGYFCLFTQAFIESVDYKGRLPEFPLFQADKGHVLELDQPQLALVSGLLNRMLAVMASDYRAKYDMLRSYLRILMHESLNMLPVVPVDSHAGAAARITAQFLSLLERQFPIDSPGQSMTLRSPAAFAQGLAVHTNHLNRSVKMITGRTTSRVISDRMIKEAQALLQHTDWSIAQIAGGLGFEEPAYFTNFFKKYTGTAPARTRVSA
ncbi:AraC family transcriptional regulator [Mucilaginibacter rubeus]|uniref:AraC family transcriptional regulator n=1 Tax=Mucilaginibacter rubeus TaxID=2027860 RepID=A0AAE6JD42_9SPHI|nr:MULTISPECIES: helix-turn-helix domain-containing protein [Mucilaginibacter]QEM02597.1 AraC family transcriptional regulator [Mucilaginibacter rubeus]QEM15218.1 AraC family transcriptional regulator [Mucilaginibacter gossypii]QTE42058.1 AraC family transcriptional regulator [Mucilaginibacter rubeus]QTE48659.1 AraC family transcriptional regulator [Mucilaginibacter rubeus]QTE60045.1 AraC family transcriptional regulator [Mucilaginibacter rubeus]